MSQIPVGDTLMLGTQLPEPLSKESRRYLYGTRPDEVISISYGLLAQNITKAPLTERGPVSRAFSKAFFELYRRLKVPEP